MKKFGLKLEALKVESFQTLPETTLRGTVHAAEEVVDLRGTRYTRCYVECTVCSMSNCFSNERTEVDCIC